MASAPSGRPPASIATKDDVTALATQIEGESAKTEGGFAKIDSQFQAVHHR